jgi:UDP-glucose:glycoprotein glucosyltransferase
LTGKSTTRVSFVHNPSTGKSATGHTSEFIGRLVASGRLSKVEPAVLLDMLAEDGKLRESVWEAQQIIADAVDDSAFVRGSRFMLRELKVQPGELALIVNGRVREFSRIDQTG